MQTSIEPSATGAPQGDAPQLPTTLNPQTPTPANSEPPPRPALTVAEKPPSPELALPNVPSEAGQAVAQPTVAQSPEGISGAVIALPKAKPLPSSFIFGKVDVRTPEEDREFEECENLLRQGLMNSLKVGDVLTRIRKKKLYKNEHVGFFEYCLERWGLGRSHVGRLIAAAEIYSVLATLPAGIPMPECEAQVRPLKGLSPDQAQEAWMQALGMCRLPYVTAHVVKRAVKLVLKSTQPAPTPRSNAPTQERYRLRQSLRTNLDDLEALVMANSHREVVLAKVGEIRRLLQPLLSPKKTKV